MMIQSIEMIFQSILLEHVDMLTCFSILFFQCWSKKLQHVTRYGQPHSFPEKDLLSWFVFHSYFLIPFFFVFIVGIFMVTAATTLGRVVPHGVGL